MESYAHKFAKQLVAEWLRENTLGEGQYQVLSLQPLTSLIPKNAPDKGIFVEFPVYCRSSLTDPLTYTPVEKEVPMFIFDIAVMCSERIGFAIEIVHHHEVPEYKIDRLRRMTEDFPFTMFRIEAQWVLNQCKIPRQLQTVKLLPAPKKTRTMTEHGFVWK